MGIRECREGKDAMYNSTSTTYHAVSSVRGIARTAVTHREIASLQCFLETRSETSPWGDTGTMARGYEPVKNEGMIRYQIIHLENLDTRSN